MSYVRHSHTLVAPSDQRRGGSDVRVSLPRSTAPLSGFVLMGLLATASGPTRARAVVTEPERALLGAVSTQVPAVRGNVAGAYPPLSGEAALLGKGSGLILLASPSGEPAAVSFGDGARALLHHGPSGHGTASGGLIGTASVPGDSEESLR